ncbi:bifunctional diaminohydroxyphosphoribosylaminopyrimidine deaminase/5-amino-6-(5-phosphoribosylamino)uracil reductase RibD [Cyanobium sp. ATX 6A2]|jgi:diaminohydroxyphosphoribosylaminopyrimidine deaminase/5-amino-6-(5-phosphoribosylamino)uracil reductase|uniref:bifunctional diaminohydroxyphosphoribosylaminopyrimidine deaminase/5-amino-6-(5-phosphoribosylamino)uracil reductase RibD n=1 Tax=Cyanobium sp. ATX 6A2 TaxID=2823700 RepID=UPI0020CEC2FE|nr:bifunctional diaminohydroxyphosphoribosylaminopyrimidine deaminase/5-amino-6-(5-phosphoribosylamino)uracil reductase RibD [Cyanobium sp. ATX 6A2]MCP9888860.1 bifunctional diaminohydroxyphosphoribosylaminopyrimidine deaminase/5-amino-6-(5-phosphoribosylamino)uracil reductase RibD [Cyanobium sp. ATX 6A2]
MRRALQLAALASGRTSPNPLVGAVLLDRQGVLVGEGFHARAGEPHAEAMALAQAGERAGGGTLVVTLEPCCHHGRTPPCSTAVINAGIRRVVIAMADPNPQVNGGGIAELRAAGVEVISGVGAAEARELNAAFLHRLASGRALGILKWAMGVDGRIALSNGASQWISSPAARHWVHGLRSRCDAVIVGGGTVRADNPLLTSRGRRRPEPLRVVLSRSLDLPNEARLWDQEVAPTLVAHGVEAPPRARFQLDERGVERLLLPSCTPAALLVALAQRGCNQVLWECGPALAAAALADGAVQRIAAVIAPRVMGGTPACTPVGELGFTDLSQVPSWRSREPQLLGSDLLWQLENR